jgi:hypothetical protein
MPMVTPSGKVVLECEPLWYLSPSPCEYQTLMPLSYSCAGPFKRCALSLLSIHHRPGP